MASGNVTTLLSSGLDAFTNLYDVYITVPTALSSEAMGTSAFQGEIAVRALDFQPPELSAQKYKTGYKAVDISKLAPKFEGEREFELEFRIDADYDIYNLFIAWKHLWADPSDEGSFNFGSLSQANLGLDRYGIIQVAGYKANTSLDSVQDPNNSTSMIGVMWEFKDVICVNATPPSYTRDTANPATFKAKFIFGRYIEPN